MINNNKSNDNSKYNNNKSRKIKNNNIEDKEKITTKIILETRNISKDQNDENEAKNEVKRDDSKWKYNKNELLERKKKLLKDKSLIKSVKKN